MTDRFSNFADLAEHYAREIATPDYARAFMEQTELAKLSIEHEPSAAEMPDPDVAQAAIEMMLATVFDLFRDTRMEDFASEVAWGIANSFHVVAKRLDDREDSMANRLQEKLREYDPSEVYATDLEDLTMQARSLAECRDAMECMRDHAARIYLVETGRPFSPVRGSRVSSKTNASMIEARDYLAAQKAQRREQFAPSGPVVVFSVVTNNLDHLKQQLDRTPGNKTSALEVTGKIEVEPRHSNPIDSRQVPELRMSTELKAKLDAVLGPAPQAPVRQLPVPEKSLGLDL